MGSLVQTDLPSNSAANTASLPCLTFVFSHVSRFVKKSVSRTHVIVIFYRSPESWFFSPFLPRGS